MPNRCLILEDHPDSRRWLSEAVAECFPGIEVIETASLGEARDRLTQFEPDLALIDLKLPDGSGTRLIDTLANRTPPCLCVVVTLFDDDAHLFPALRAGAQGYVLKDQSRDELAALLRGISEGRPPLSPSIARRLLRHFQPAPAADQPALTPRETEVLQLIAKGLAVAQVARMLELSPHTAAGYVKDIYRKLAISSRAEAALEAARMGLT